MSGGCRSTLKSYVASGFSSQAMTSGAIQYGVPMNVFLLPTVLSNWADTPKSTTEQINTNKHTLLKPLFFYRIPDTTGALLNSIMDSKRGTNCSTHKSFPHLQTHTYTHFIIPSPLGFRGGGESQFFSNLQHERWQSCREMSRLVFSIK